jgi:hypothetical protein
MDLGIVSVCGRIRVASPPARTTACTAGLLADEATLDTPGPPD